MEKIENRMQIDEMKKLLEAKKYLDAMAVADSINWRKVANINELLVGSEVYEAAGQVEEARDLLLLAHERSPIGRIITYRLCMISIKMDDMESAKEYYNEYVQIAPHDSLKYLLKYHINVKLKADNNTLIKILEDFKEQDFLEDWAYELAYLYHKTNQAEKCIDLCDEIILWFGDGPVVERALELKMLYQPLDKLQEEKYRHIQMKKDGITEITAGEPLQSGEIVHKTVAIPSVELSPERFNTVNLQAEIKKSIEEIMKATEAGEVSENMEAIKNLVEEIPYLQVQQEEEEADTQEVSVNDRFQEYLSEGNDGQISLFLPDEGQVEQQIEGQITIEDVLADWEKTKRAAEAAMEEAKATQLENAKAKALKEAKNVLSRLEEAMPKFDAGMTSSELLKEEYTQSQGFEIPKLSADGVKQGSVSIPIINPLPEEVVLTEEAPAGGIIQEEEPTTQWAPPALEEENEDVDLKEASEMIADVNKLLQSEIDRLTDDEISEETENDIESTIEEALPDDVAEDISEEVEEELPIIEDIVVEEPVDDAVEEIEIPDEYVPIITDSEELEEIPQEETIEDDFELPKIELPEDLFAEIKADATDNIIPNVEEVKLQDEEPKRIVPEDIMPTINQDVLKPEEIVELVDEKILEKAITAEIPDLDLDDEDFQIFSYFLPLKGMRNNIHQVLTGAAAHIKKSDSSGNIVIIGDAGSGKTQMARSIITVLQKKTGKPTGGVGKISGDKLNEKDIQSLFERVHGGCLIIEDAGQISKETAVTLSLLMEQDHTGTIIIMEDTRKGIEAALSRDASFARRFTEKIIIPVFSIDELVEFGKTYAIEAGYSIDDMGILALYNRINLIGRYDHATTIREVSDIMEDAIEKASKPGLFKRPKIDMDGNIILREKDFE